MSAPTLRSRPLEAAAFAPYGRVHAAAAGMGRPVNQGRGERFDLAALGHDPAADRPTLALYRAAATPLPFRVELLERHPWSEQLFAPLQGADWWVVVAPARADGPDPDAIAVFLARPGQVVVYGAGVWHYPLAPAGHAADFHMAMWETGRGDDTEFVTIALPPLVVG